MMSFILSLLLHILVFVVLFFGLSHPSQPLIVNKGETIIHAVAVDNTQIEALEKKIQDQKNQEAQEKVERQKKLDAEVKAKRLAEAKHIEEEKAIALQQQKAAEEKKRLLELEKIEKEKKKQAEQAAEAARQLKDKQLKEEKQKQYDAAVALQKKIAAKQAAIDQQRPQAINGMVDQYKGLILEAIGQHWLVPTGVSPSLACQLIITVNAQGNVETVQLIKSSGNILLDQSAIAAVYKASPLPLPSDKDAAAVFKQLRLTLKPEQILES